MKIYSIIRGTEWLTTYTYFGVVSAKRTGFTQENVVGVRTFDKDGNCASKGINMIYDTRQARAKWLVQSTGKWGTSVVVDSEGIDVLTSKGKEPLMDSEVIKSIDEYAKEMYDDRKKNETLV